MDAIGALTGRLFELASDAARPPVRLVKMIGDSAMFASTEPGALLDAVTGLVEAHGGEEMPSLRAGRRSARRSAGAGTGTGGRSTTRRESPDSPVPTASSSTTS
jgi:hypothetical protein